MKRMRDSNELIETLMFSVPKFNVIAQSSQPEHSIHNRFLFFFTPTTQFLLPARPRDRRNVVPEIEAL